MLCLALISLLWGAAGWSQSAGGPRYAGTRAEVVKQSAPKYPRGSKKRGQEGWVMLSFVIRENGRVADPLIEDSSGEPDFDKSAVQAVKGWRYEPATLDGEAVPQRQTRLVLTFAMDLPRRGASLRFREGYGRATEALAKGNYQGAEGEWQSLAEYDGWNLYEIARLWALYGLIGEAAGDDAKAMAGLERATRGGVAYLEKDFYLAALRKIFALKLRADDHAGALIIYSRLERQPGALEGFPKITEAAQALRAMVTGDEVLAVQGGLENVAGKPMWTRRLLRRQIRLEAIRGKLDKVDFRCEWGRATHKPVEGVTWVLPAEWGDCDVYLTGKRGARFTLLELPASVDGTTESAPD